jgi:hypothetical protein
MIRAGWGTMGKGSTGTTGGVMGGGRGEEAVERPRGTELCGQLHPERRGAVFHALIQFEMCSSPLTDISPRQFVTARTVPRIDAVLTFIKYSKFARITHCPTVAFRLTDVSESAHTPRN